ncbi:hypothetical protein Tco_0341837 [Tanacetum coccineum]
MSDNSLNKTKQIWKPKGKLSDNSLNKTKQVWKATGKIFANVGYQWRSTRKKFALGELCPLTKLSVQCSIITANHHDPNKNWGTEIPNSPHYNRHGHDRQDGSDNHRNNNQDSGNNDNVGKYK